METAAGIRRQNRFQVLRAIHADPMPTRKSIAGQTDLSLATVTSIVGELIAGGVVCEVAIRRQPAGRPTAQLALNPNCGVLLGVDIAETYVHVEVFDTSLTSLAATQCELHGSKNSPRLVADRVREAISQAAQSQVIEGRQILAVGVSAPGQVDQVGGTSVFAPNWDWHDVPLREMLAGAVEAPIVLDNPLKAQAIAELWANGGGSVEVLVVLNVGTGVGAGIAINRQLFRGPTNSAGEWGHTVLVADGRPCRCGSRGCIEAYVGAPGIVETLREIAPTSPILGGDQTTVLRSLRTAIDAGDETALLALERTGRYLGMAIANVVNMLNPQKVVLGGWVARTLGDRLLEAARPSIKTHALATPLDAAEIVLQRLPGNPVSLGAATIALEQFLDSITDVTRPADAPR